MFMHLGSWTLDFGPLVVGLELRISDRRPLISDVGAYMLNLYFGSLIVDLGILDVKLEM